MNNRSGKPVYLTKARYEELRKELERLETVERTKMIEELRSSPLSGMGRSTMDPAREKQAFLEGRIAKLRAILASAQITEDQLPNGPIEEVLIGTTVTVYDLEREVTLHYSIVGSEEVDISTGRISYLSPIGQGLLGHHVGDAVRVVTPAGDVEYRIERIETLQV